MTAPQGRTFETRVKEVITVTPAEPKRADDGEMVVPDFVIDTLARCLLPQVQAFYDNPEGQMAFESWKQSQKRNNNMPYKEELL